MHAIRLLRLLREPLTLETVAQNVGSHRSSICSAEKYGRISKALRKRLARFYAIPETTLFQKIDTTQMHDKLVAALSTKKDTP